MLEPEPFSNDLSTRVETFQVWVLTASKDAKAASRLPGSKVTFEIFPVYCAATILGYVDIHIHGFYTWVNHGRPAKQLRNVEARRSFYEAAQNSARQVGAALLQQLSHGDPRS